MPFELDHLFIWTEPDAPAAQKLIDFGLTEGPSNVHPGQGTANRRFFFHNAMLELLWVHDMAEAQSELTQPTTLGDRFNPQGQTTSSFGLCLRPSSAITTDAPFQGWHYRPTYLPEHLSVWIGNNVTQLAEPFLFYLSFGGRPDGKPAEKRPPLEHSIGFKEMTAVQIQSPHFTQLSPELQAVATVDGIAIAQPASYGIASGETELLEITFDQGQAGQSISFEPELPLRFHW